MKKSTNPAFRGIGFYILILIFLLGTIAFMYSSTEPETLSYSEVYDYFKEEQVSKFIIDGNTLAFELNDGKQLSYELPNWNWFYNDLGDLILEQKEAGIIEEYDIRAASEMPWWVSFVPYILMIVIFGLFWYYMMNKADGGAGKAMSFGKARAKIANADDKKKVTFKDVEGAEEEKAELAELVDFLKAPGKFQEIGARIPKGVLLVGPPGTGKTLLAKAVAGEAGVPFLSISGSDFVELYVGVGASRVRDLFEQAKKQQPAIIFIDEIDAVGRHRGAGLGGGHDEREQTLNQLLVEMDGFGANEGVIIIAATNRPDILDPALLRPGRFDRQVYVGLPDIKGREAILRLHGKNKKFEPNVDFAAIAKSTTGFTGADLENLLNESALLAARRNKLRIGDAELQEAFVKVIMGPEKKSRKISEKDRRLTAYHEAGHAVVNKFLPTQDPVHQISIIPRGRAGGYNLNLPTEDKSYSSKSEMLEDIVALLGGRVAEKLILDDISTGASNDIERSSDLVRKMIMKYGMNDRLGPITYGSANEEVFLGKEMGHSRNYSERVAAEIDEEVRSTIEAAYKRCEQILTDNLDSLHRVAEYLLKHETMDGPTFDRIMAGDDIAVIESDLEEIAAKKREEEKKLRMEAEEAMRKEMQSAMTPPPWIPPGDPQYEKYKEEMAKKQAALERELDPKANPDEVKEKNDRVDH